MSLDCDYPAPCSCGCHWGGEAVSAPDPAAALREYVAARQSSQRLTDSHAEGALHNSAPALLAYVERLEAERDRLRGALRIAVGWVTSGRGSRTNEELIELALGIAGLGPLDRKTLEEVKP